MCGQREEDAMKTKEIMTRSPVCCSTGDSMKDVAQLMRDQECGVVPIVDEQPGSIVGIVTDRDLTVRGLAFGSSPDTPAGQLTTRGPSCCSEADAAQALDRKM